MREFPGHVRTNPFMGLTLATSSTNATFLPQAGAEVQPWYALRVRTRFEFTTSNILRDKGFEHFLPFYHSQRRWSDRVKEVDTPLFPGYVFCRLDAAAPLPVLMTPGVIDIISAGRTPIPVNEHEISALQEICDSGLAMQPWPYLEVGRRVGIERGPLAGSKGVVVELKGRYRLVASISLLQRSVAAEIDRDWIRPLG
jgi:transcription antitermination factor NusG